MGQRLTTAYMVCTTRRVGAIRWSHRPSDRPRRPSSPRSSCACGVGGAAGAGWSTGCSPSSPACCSRPCGRSRRACCWAHPARPARCPRPRPNWWRPSGRELLGRARPASCRWPQRSPAAGSAGPRSARVPCLQEPATRRRAFK